MIHDNGNAAYISASANGFSGKGVPESIYRDAACDSRPSESRPPCGPQVPNRFTVIINDPFTALIFRPPFLELVEQVASERDFAVIMPSGAFGRARHESSPGGFRYIGPCQTEKLRRAGACACAIPKPYQPLDVCRGYLQDFA